MKEAATIIAVTVAIVGMISAVAVVIAGNVDALATEFRQTLIELSVRIGMLERTIYPQR